MTHAGGRGRRGTCGCGTHAPIQPIDLVLVDMNRERTHTTDLFHLFYALCIYRLMHKLYCFCGCAVTFMLTNPREKDEDRILMRMHVTEHIPGRTRIGGTTIAVHDLHIDTCPPPVRL